MLAAPLLREGMPLGVIVIARGPAVRPFSAKQIALLETFANQAVIAIENVRLFNELRARTAELTHSVEQLTALGEVSRAVSSTSTSRRCCRPSSSARISSPGRRLRDLGVREAAEEFRLRASHYADERDAAILPAPGGVTTIPKGRGLTTRVTELRQPVQIPDIAVEGAYESPVRNALIDAGHRALLGVPLLREDEVIGVLAVTSKTPGDVRRRRSSGCSDLRHPVRPGHPERPALPRDRGQEPAARGRQPPQVRVPGQHVPRAADAR